MPTSAIIPLSEKRSDEPVARRDSAREARELERGVPIRAISRAISVLQAINRGGSLSMMQIAQASQVPYPTACRIVQTLVHEGLVERIGGCKRYRPTALVQTLSHGFCGHGPLLSAAEPQMAALTRQIGWPISIATHVGSSMVLRASTHQLTPLTFNNYHPGYAIPILACASGLVHLAFCDADERETIHDHLSRFADEETRHMLHNAFEGGLFERVRESGFATRAYNLFTRNPGKTSSIAVPLLRSGRIEAALSVAFFASAVELEDAIRELRPRLAECAEAIACDMAAAWGDGSAAPGLQ